MRALQRFGRVAVVMAFALACATATAAPRRLDFTWSGASFQNNARATGYIVFETTQLQNPTVPAGSFQLFTLPSPAVLDLSITITGATSGNGTFNLASFRNVVWSTNAGTLDLTRSLIGQPTSGAPWATAYNNTAGDFNLFTTSVGARAAGPYASAPDGGAIGPQGTNYFTLTTNGGTGNPMLLTGLAPGGGSFVSNVPATGAWGLAALGVLLALAGVFAARRTRVR